MNELDIQTYHVNTDDFCKASSWKWGSVNGAMTGAYKRLLNNMYGAPKEDNMNTETEKNAKRREIMNQLKVDDEIYSEFDQCRNKRLKIFAFDYSHYRVGCLYEIRRQGYQKITRFWIDPLTIINYASRYCIPTPKHIIVNEDSKVTVVLWDDNTKTIVKCSETDQYDPHAAYCAAFAKKCYGTNSNLKKTIEKCTVYQVNKKTIRNKLIEAINEAGNVNPFSPEDIKQALGTKGEKE